jgi:hypothetical protein
MKLGYIYKLTTPLSTMIYIGSTFNKIARKSNHKSNGITGKSKSTSRYIVKDKGWKMIIMDEIVVENKKELKHYEMNYISTYKKFCVNKITGTYDNPKAYYQAKKDQLNKKIICPICGAKHNCQNRIQHSKSAKHQKAIIKAERALAYQEKIKNKKYIIKKYIKKII